MDFWIFMLAMILLTPVIMIALGSIYAKKAPKEINNFTGYRTTMSMKNMDTWNFAHQYYAKVWRFVGWVMLISSFVAMIFVCGKDTNTVGSFSLIVIVIQMIILIGSIAPTEIALRKTFDENGNRR
ncbi:MAG: SdpI family protein [Bacillota bacterium]|nr:SdpI family protein [Bacillota bacterium]